MNCSVIVQIINLIWLFIFELSIKFVLEVNFAFKQSNISVIRSFEIELILFTALIRANLRDPWHIWDNGEPYVWSIMTIKQI